MAGISNSEEAAILDARLDRTAVYRLALYKHSSGTVGTQPNENGSLPSGLSELSGSGYSAPNINASATEWGAAVPGDPTTKSGPTGSTVWTFGTATAAWTSGSEAVTAWSIIETTTRTVTASTTNASATVTVTSGTMTSADIGRQVSGTNIPTNTVITAVASSTSFTISNNATGTGSGITVTVGPRVCYSGPLWDSTASNAVTSCVTTSSSDMITNSAGSISANYIGATVTGTGVPASTYLLAVGADGKTGWLSNACTASGTVTITFTGANTTKTYTTGDAPQFDSSNQITVKLGDVGNAF